MMVIVGHHAGRSGTSAMMGLLDRGGAEVGTREEFSTAKPMNPKGFYELLPHNRFLKNVYPEVYPYVSDPPGFEKIDRIGRENAADYDELLTSLFPGDGAAALKSPRLLSIPLFEALDRWDIRILKMDRDVETHVASIMRVWRKAGDPRKYYASERFVREYVTRWREWTHRLLTQSGFDYRIVNFEDVIEAPQTVMESVSEFTGLKVPPMKQLEEWIDPSLANRERLPGDRSTLSLPNRVMQEARMAGKLLAYMAIGRWPHR